MRTNYNDSSRSGGRYPKRQGSGGKSGGGSGGGSNGSNGSRRPQGGRRPGQGGGGTVNAAGASSARNKYLELAKEALSNGNRVEAENFFQHAEHYSKILNAAMESRREREESNADSGHERRHNHHHTERANETAVATQEPVVQSTVEQDVPTAPVE